MLESIGSGLSSRRSPSALLLDLWSTFMPRCEGHSFAPCRLLFVPGFMFWETTRTRFHEIRAATVFLVQRSGFGNGRGCWLQPCSWTTGTGAGGRAAERRARFLDFV